MTVDVVVPPKWVCEIHIQKKNKINNSEYDETSVVEIHQIMRGHDGDIPDHEWIGTGLRFRKPDRTWGDVVNLAKDNLIKSVDTVEEVTDTNALYFVGDDTKEIYIVDKNGNKEKQTIGKQFRFFDSNGNQIG